jgi:hypothetical protein
MSAKAVESPPPCFDCGTKPTERLTEMFVDISERKRIALGQTPAERPVFRKVHGVAHGWLERTKNIPEDLKIGVFSHERLLAWTRFSSDTTPMSSDLKTTIGIGLKLFGVPGQKALGDEGDTADFIMQNFPVFFVDDAKEMCEFTYAGVVEGDYPGYLKRHPKVAHILDSMQQIEGSALTATYWAILPFMAGEGRYVKYRLEPEATPENVPNSAANYLAQDFAARLRHQDYRFRLMAQRRTNPKSMPLDKATVEWPEKESPFLHVATLVPPKQDVGTRGQVEYGQSLAFNIFRLPPEQAPAPESSIAAARKEVYAASAEVRHVANGRPLGDASEPRNPVSPAPEVDTCIVKAAIYPPIGIARVGSSSDEWFVGPEAPEPRREPLGFYRDGKGALKRQAARFRIYGLNARGEIVRELTGEDSNAEITWTVELANTKAAWYGFQIALDIPEASAAPPTQLRNAAASDRSQLSIQPGPRHVSGPEAAPQRFDSGVFMGKKVYLGEIFTDESARLIVLGGHGSSASSDGSFAITFANNEGWHDDVSDGPVTAKVVLGGAELEVVPAWVIVAPPNYGPMRKSVRTMWDLMRDVAIKAGTLARPARPSFARDIQPIFERLSGLQWVNAGFAAEFGWHGAVDLVSQEKLVELADAGPASREVRKVVANAFRRFPVDSWSPKPWPWVYGDAMANPPAPTPRQHAALTDTQLAMLDQWAAGDFDANYDPGCERIHDVDRIPIAEQGEVLTRAALEFCLADAFHPGCEMTWPVRSSTMYMAPFRFRHAPPGWISPNLGETVTYDAIVGPNGPLAGQIPGGLTRWMAVPWQTDTASCQSGYDKSYDPYTPTFWPARVPNQVLTADNYHVVVDAKRPLSERRAAFTNRASWLDPLGSGSYTEMINDMVAHFNHLGVVEARDGPKDCNAFPPVIEVEDQHKSIKDVTGLDDGERSRTHEMRLSATQGAAPRPTQTIDLTQIEKVRRFPGGLPPQLR